MATEHSRHLGTYFSQKASVGRSAAQDGENGRKSKEAASSKDHSERRRAETMR
jgi:hypothetical protein